MANGGTFGELVEGGRGKMAILSAAMLAIAGMGWWTSETGRDAIEGLRVERRAEIAESRTERRAEIAALRTDMEARFAVVRSELAELESELRELVADSLQSNQTTSDYRMEAITERFGRIDTALQNHISRTEFEYFTRDAERRLTALADFAEWVRDRLGSRSPRDSQGSR